MPRLVQRSPRRSKRCRCSSKGSSHGSFNCSNKCWTARTEGHKATGLEGQPHPSALRHMHTPFLRDLATSSLSMPCRLKSLHAALYDCLAEWKSSRQAYVYQEGGSHTLKLRPSALALGHTLTAAMYSYAAASCTAIFSFRATLRASSYACSALSRSPCSVCREPMDMWHLMTVSMSFSSLGEGGGGCVTIYTS